MSVAFPVAIGLLFTHELNAMTAREWRIFPGLRRLNESVARPIFLYAHIPLFGGVIAGLVISPDAWVVGLSWFCVAHLAAHLALHRHPENEFGNLGSWLLIAGAGLAGALELLLGAL